MGLSRTPDIISVTSTNYNLIGTPPEQFTVPSAYMVRLSLDEGKILKRHKFMVKRKLFTARERVARLAVSVLLVIWMVLLFPAPGFAQASDDLNSLKKQMDRIEDDQKLMWQVSMPAWTRINMRRASVKTWRKEKKPGSMEHLSFSWGSPKLTVKRSSPPKCWKAPCRSLA